MPVRTAIIAKFIKNNDKYLDNSSLLLLRIFIPKYNKKVKFIGSTIKITMLLSKTTKLHHNI